MSVKVPMYHIRVDGTFAIRSFTRFKKFCQSFLAEFFSEKKAAFQAAEDAFCFAREIMLES